MRYLHSIPLLLMSFSICSHALASSPGGIRPPQVLASSPGGIRPPQVLASSPGGIRPPQLLA